MPFQLKRPVVFPSADSADEDGVVAFGGDLSVDTLLQAYRTGIFPWFSASDPLPIWWSPPVRMVLPPGRHYTSKSMKQVMNRNTFSCTFDKDFRSVIEVCAMIDRDDQDGTWITQEMIEAYCDLHKAGYAHSVEVWKGETLVGGLYGVAINGAFCGESMFSLVSNASKFAFIQLSEFLKRNGFMILDCQNYTEHLESLGAFLINRNDYLVILNEALKLPGIPGTWLNKE